MCTLRRFKKYFTLGESVEYLSEKTNQQLYISDLFALSILSDLRFSLYMPISMLARKCKLLKDPSEFILFEENIEFQDDDALTKGDFFDLAMIGEEIGYLYSRYRDSTQGDVLLEGKKSGVERGFFVQNESGVYSLLENYDANPDFKGSDASFNPRIYSDSSDTPFVKDVETQHNKNRESFLQSSFNTFHADKIYVESTSIPPGSELVIRVSELDRFADVLYDKKGVAVKHQETTLKEKKLSSKEKNTLLVLIAALCKHSKTDYTQRGIASSIEAMTEQLGAKVSDDTIRNILKEIPDALEARSK